MRRAVQLPPLLDDLFSKVTSCSMILTGLLCLSGDGLRNSVRGHLANMSTWVGIVKGLEVRIFFGPMTWPSGVAGAASATLHPAPHGCTLPAALQIPGSCVSTCPTCARDGCLACGRCCLTTTPDAEGLTFFLAYQQRRAKTTQRACYDLGFARGLLLTEGICGKLDGTIVPHGFWSPPSAAPF